jgi:hypothetical protein
MWNATVPVITLGMTPAILPLKMKHPPHAYVRAYNMNARLCVRKDRTCTICSICSIWQHRHPPHPFIRYAQNRHAYTTHADTLIRSPSTRLYNPHRHAYTITRAHTHPNQASKCSEMRQNTASPQPEPLPLRRDYKPTII